MKRRYFLSILSISTFLILITGYNNCGSNLRFSLEPSMDLGTNTGNPGTNPSGNQAPADFSQTLVHDMCVVLTGCNPGLDQSECEASLATSPGFNQDLNNSADVAISPISTSTQVAMSSCLQEVQGLQCSDTTVENAYIPGTENPYQNAYEMIPSDPATCKAVLPPAPLQ